MKNSSSRRADDIASTKLISSMIPQESHELEDRCRQERDLGEEFAQEAQEWVALAGRLSNEVKALRKEAEQTKRLREVRGVCTIR